MGTLATWSPRQPGSPVQITVPGANRFFKLPAHSPESVAAAALWTASYDPLDENLSDVVLYGCCVDQLRPQSVAVVQSIPFERLLSRGKRPLASGKYWPIADLRNSETLPIRMIAFGESSR